jgi:hypothetical protein
MRGQSRVSSPTAPSTDHGCPADTVRDRCLWHASGTAGENDEGRTGGDGSQLGQTVRPSSVTTDSWARTHRARGSLQGRWIETDGAAKGSIATGRLGRHRAVIQSRRCITAEQIKNDGGQAATEATTIAMYQVVAGRRQAIDTMMWAGPKLKPDCSSFLTHY